MERAYARIERVELQMKLRNGALVGGALRRGARVFDLLLEIQSRAQRDHQLGVVLRDGNRDHLLLLL